MRNGVKTCVDAICTTRTINPDIGGIGGRNTLVVAYLHRLT